MHFNGGSAGYSATTYQGNTETDSSSPAPGTIISTIPTEKKILSKNRYSEVVFVGNDGLSHTARTVVNKSRRSFKNLLNNLIVLIKAWSMLLCPIVTMVLYAQPLAVISFETHVFLLKSSIVLYPLAVIAEAVLKLATKKEKTKACVLEVFVQKHSGENGVSYKYPTVMYHYYNGEYYLCELTLKKQLSRGQQIDIYFDPKDPGDVREKFNPLSPLLEMVLVTLYIWNVVRVILGWEGGMVTNYNNDPDF